MTSGTERRLEILKYVMERQHSGQNTTKAMVVRHLKEKKMSSSETTHNIIKELIDEGKLNKKEITSQVHFLTINEDNEFNKISNFLPEIENIMNIIFEPIRKHRPGRFKGEHDLVNALQVLVDDLQGTFIEAIPILLQELLTRTNNKIHYEKDKQILNSKILHLQQKFIGMIGAKEHTTSQRLGFFMARLGHVNSKSRFSARIKRLEPNFLDECDRVARKFERVLENFKNQFLTETEQKATEPGEKSG